MNDIEKKLDGKSAYKKFSEAVGKLGLQVDLASFLAGYDSAIADMRALKEEAWPVVVDALEDTISKIEDAEAGRINWRGDFADRLRQALRSLKEGE